MQGVAAMTITITFPLTDWWLVWILGFCLGVMFVASALVLGDFLRRHGYIRPEVVAPPHEEAPRG